MGRNCAVLAVLVCCSVRAEDLVVTEFPVRTYSNRNHAAPQLVTDGDGGVILTWRDSWGTGIFTDLYALRMTPDGAPLWDPNDANNIHVDGGAASLSFDTVSDGAGGVIVAYSDRGRDWDDPDIHIQRVNHQGTSMWGTDGVHLVVEWEEQDFPEITTDGAGGAIVTWQDRRALKPWNPYGSYDVYAQRVDANGVAQWEPNGVPIATDPNQDWTPKIVSDGLGGAIITWYVSRNGQSNIYAQRVTGSGNTLWAFNGLRVCPQPSYQGCPEIVSDGNNGAIIAWWDRRDGNYRIYAQRIGPNGAALWDPSGVRVAAADAEIDQYDQKITPYGSGGAILTWRNQQVMDSDIYAQKIEPNGHLAWGSTGVPVHTGPGLLWEPGIASDAEDGAIITWYDLAQVDHDLMAQRVDADGNLAWDPNGELICGEPGEQDTPAIFTFSPGEALIVWQDERNGSEDLYGANLDWQDGCGSGMEAVLPAMLTILCLGAVTRRWWL